MNKATFAAGCFWGVEEVFRKIKGVSKTTVGYTGGKTLNPTYHEVCQGDTGHAEAVEVEFDPAQVSYQQLLEAFWSCHNPTLKNRQGPDVGEQYRSAIFCHTADQEQQAIASRDALEASEIYDNDIVTEIVKSSKFYPAEEYHQCYLAKQRGEK